MSLLLPTQRSESVRQTGSYYHTTPQSYCSPKPSSSTRQHHEREAAHLRCIGAYNPSPRIARAGCVDAYTPTTPHQPSPTATRRKLTTLSPHGVLLSVVVHGSSVHFSSYYACLLSPFAYLCTRLSPRSVSAVRAAIYTGFFLVCMCYDGILLLLLQQAAACSQCDFHRQPGGQQQY